MNGNIVARLTGLSIFVSVTILAGCTVGPDFQRPAAPTLSTYVSRPLVSEGIGEKFRKGTQALIPGTDVPAKWWTQFHAPALDAWEEEALRANPDLAADRASLNQARELYLAQKGGLLPSVGLSGQAVRQKDSQVVSPTLAQPLSEFTLYTGQASISYRLDLFGAVRRGVEQASALAEQQRFQYEAAYLSLTTNVAVAAIQVASLTDQIRAQENLIEAARKLLEIERSEEQLGQIAGAEVSTQALALAQAEAALPPLRKALAQQEDLLAALIGHYPSEAQLPPLRLSEFTLPSSLPVTLPSGLVNQRPDIRAAEAALHAATAAVGVAEADRLPDLELNASFGGASTALSNLLGSGNQAWSAAIGVTQPLFDGGALRHKQKAAEAALDQAREQYRSIVIGAFQNVADTLYAVEHDADALAADTTAVQAAEKALGIAQARVRLGSTAGASVLGIQQNYQAAVISLAQAEANRLTDTVMLYQALGGGWWNRPKKF